MNTSTLDELAQKYGTDKATVHPTGAHGYTPFYERVFAPLRDKEIKLLEIGVGGGESIQTWLEYFPNARVFGVDTTRDTNDWNTPDGQIPRYKSVCGDQAGETFWNCFIADYGGDWDIVIDDGGHFSNQIVMSFQKLWPFVKPGGLYCIEDLAVCYGAGTIFVPEGSPNHMDWILERMHHINKTSDIDSLFFSKELAIFQKKA